jgi:predicted  nucleic acid-binding Zn-ribbon protein
VADIRHDLHVLISIAKVDAAVNAARTELALLPRQIDELNRSIQAIEARETQTKDVFEQMVKERRTIEQQLKDNEEKEKKYRLQLMEVKTNKEYTAMLHEIGHIKTDTDAKEERLLILMDALERETGQTETLMAEGARKKAELTQARGVLEERMRSLQGEMSQLESGKPKLLRELDPQIERRYDRLLSKLHDFAVTHVVDGTCQGCFTRIPPQVAVEVARNDKLITCEACGRILVYYIA